MNHYFTDNRQLAQNRKEITFRFSCFNFSFITDNGVFSKEYIDYGSMIFLEALEKEKLGNNLLDVGCGYGTLGVVLKKMNPASKVTMVDVNPRALELAVINAEKNETEVDIRQSDIYENVSENNFTDIITNPPIRAGKAVIYRIFEEAYEHLADGGHLYVVIRKQHGALSAQKKIASVFGNCDIIHKDRGYFVLKSKKQIDNLTII